MADSTKIEWADATFNPWIGCQRVSAGCDHCYAETLMDQRLGRVEWGPHGTRRRTSAGYWRQPLLWNRRAAARGRRMRVFCASLADVFDNKAPRGAQVGHWSLIERTPNLIWMLLTKRPENMALRAPLAWGGGHRVPENVWLGITAENQIEYDRRWPLVADWNAAVRFVSYEPALGPLDITGHEEKPDWMICGGESGPNARPMYLGWARAIRDQCDAGGIPFFFKQHGEWSLHVAEHIPVKGDRLAWVSPAGKVRRVNEIPRGEHDLHWMQVARVGKKKAGRLLDRHEWNELPEEAI